MSLANSGIIASIDGAIAQMLGAVGEPVKIYPLDQGNSITVAAIITGGAFERFGVSGGFYDEIQFIAAVRKSDLGKFVPQPGMLVDARETELRIDNDGVTFFRAHYRLRLVSRNAPR
jgi:hypothetical protein